MVSWSKRELQCAVAFVVAVVGLCRPLHAVDGVIEINQARAVKGGITAGDSAGFPVTIGESGSYRLTGNLNPPAGVNGITITAFDVTIDLNGFIIKGTTNCTGCPVTSCQSGTGNGIEVSGTAENVSIRNGTVSNFPQSGIRLYHRGTVDHVTATRNGEHGIVVVVGSTVIRHTESSNNGYDGISSGQGEVSYSFAQCNGGYGVNNPFAVLDHINATSNGKSGIFGGSTITDSYSQDNAWCGIETNSHPATISNNLIRDNAQCGIKMSNAAGTVIGNTIVGNGSANFGRAMDLPVGTNPYPVGYANNNIRGPCVGGPLVIGGQAMGPNLCRGFLVSPWPLTINPTEDYCYSNCTITP